MTGDNYLLSKFALSGQPCGESTNVGVPGRGISDGGAARRCRYLSITLTTPQLPAGNLGSFVAHIQRRTCWVVSGLSATCALDNLDGLWSCRKLRGVRQIGHVNYVSRAVF